MQYIDAHVHFDVTSCVLPSSIYPLLNATQGNEWSFLEALYQQNSSLIPFFGIHPWFVDRENINVVTDLEKLIKDNPAYHVGEIGLDRIRAKRYPETLGLDKQREFFKAQFEMAITYDRVMSIHCVKAWDVLFEVLKLYRPPFRAILHYFNSSANIMQKLIKLGFYISFVPGIYTSNHHKQLAAFNACPIERLLLESDVNTGDNEALLISHYEQAAKARNMTVEALQKAVADNVARLFSGNDHP